jgi:hypothetical protein
MELSLYDDVSSKNSSSDCQKMKIPKLNKKHQGFNNIRNLQILLKPRKLYRTENSCYIDYLTYLAPK